MPNSSDAVILRVGIDGYWRAQDFSDFYGSIDTIYNVLTVIAIEEQSAEDFDQFYRKREDIYFRRWSERQLALITEKPTAFHFLSGPAFVAATRFLDASTFLRQDERLHVRRCHYASPGLTDFTGIGQVLGHVKDFLLKCIEIAVSRRERELKNKLLEQEIEGKALENLGLRIKTLRDIGYSDTHCREILAKTSPAVARIQSLVERQLITHVTDEVNDD